LLRGADVARSAHATTAFDASAPEWETEFLDFARPLEPADFLGRRVLDVGCGFGRGAFFAARYGAEVVAVDVDPAILAAAGENNRRYPRVHLVQADAMALPFTSFVFDLVYAFGLLHHLQDATKGVHELADRVRPGGRLSVWVYGPRQGTAAALSAALRGMTRDMPSHELLNVSRTIATVLRVASHTPYRILRHLPGMHTVASHLPLHDHHRWPYDVVVADVYDRPRIPITSTSTAVELESLYLRYVL